jgi:hypothetical protein
MHAASAIVSDPTERNDTRTVEAGQNCRSALRCSVAAKLLVARARRGQYGALEAGVNSSQTLVPDRDLRATILPVPAVRAVCVAVALVGAMVISLTNAGAVAVAQSTEAPALEQEIQIRSATFPRRGWWTFGVGTKGSPLRITLGSPTLEVCPVSGDENAERIGFPRRVGFESCLRPDSSGLVTVPLTGAMLGTDGTFRYHFSVRTTAPKQDADVTIGYSRPVGGFTAVSPVGVPTNIAFTPTSTTLAVLSFVPPDTDHKVTTAMQQGKRSLSGQGSCKEFTGYARCVRGVVPGRRLTVAADADSDERVSTSLAWPSTSA